MPDLGEKAAANRLPRWNRATARVLALAIVLQSAAPAFVPVCDRAAAMTRAATCPACHAESRAHQAHGAEASPAVCHRIPTGRRLPPACCFLSVVPVCGDRAESRATLLAPVARSQPLLAIAWSAPEDFAATPATSVLPPGDVSRDTGPPDSFRQSILRL